MMNWLSIFSFRIFLHIVPMSTYHEPLTEMYILPVQSACNVYMHKGQVGVKKTTGNNYSDYFFCPASAR